MVRSCAAVLCQFEREYDEAIAVATSVLVEAERDGDVAEMAIPAIRRSAQPGGPAAPGAPVTPDPAWGTLPRDPSGPG